MTLVVAACASGGDHAASTTTTTTARIAAPIASVAPVGPSGPGGPTGRAAATCTVADLAKGVFVMPTPTVVKHEVVFGSGEDILDPPSSTNPPISTARAWRAASTFGLLIPPRHGSYQLLLGDLTSIHQYLRRPVWMIIGRGVPTVPPSGGPLGPSGAARPRRPPCYFANVIQPVNATTGRSLFAESGGVQVP